MRKLKVVLCAAILSACASGKSAERPDEEWNDPTVNEPEGAREARDEAAAERARREYERDEGAAQRADDAPPRAQGVAERPESAAPVNAGASAGVETAPARDDHRPVVADSAAGTEPDNTAVNERDQDDRTLTPTDQGGSEGDRKITQRIRQAVMRDDSLSFTAKNVKIITIDGKVTLRGPVKSQQERAAIGAAAKQVAGARVDNQLEVDE